MKKLTAALALVLVALLLSMATIGGTFASAETIIIDTDFEAVPLTNPQCPSGWYPESHEAARAQDPDRCVPYDPCSSDGLGNLWGLDPCNPFIDPDTTDLPVFTLNEDNEWVATSTIDYTTLSEQEAVDQAMEWYRRLIHDGTSPVDPFFLLAGLISMANGNLPMYL